MRVCRAADNRFVGCKITEKFVREQAFTHRKYLIVEAFRGLHLGIIQINLDFRSVCDTFVLAFPLDCDAVCKEGYFFSRRCC